MYAVYSYKNTATQAQVLRDIIKLLTGTTDLGTLSASCDVATSLIETTYGVGNNNDYDPTASGGLTQCFRMSVWDQPTEYFYVPLVITSTSLQIGGRDTWSTGTHTGTGGAMSSTTLALHTVGTTSGQIYLWTDGNCVCMRSSANDSCLSVMQFTREDLWRTALAGYKPVVINGATTQAVAVTVANESWNPALPWVFKGLNSSQVPVSAGTAGAVASTLVADVPAGTLPSNTYMVTGVIAENLVTQPVLVPIRAGGTQFSTLGASGGSVTQLSPIYYYAGPSLPIISDEIVFGAERYRPISTLFKLCVRVS